MHLPVSHRPAAGHKGAARATSPLHEAVTPLHQAARAAQPPQPAGRDGTASRASARSRHGPGTVAAITGTRRGRTRAGYGGHPIPDHRLRRYAHPRRRNLRLPGLYLTFTE
jgi:hypothetical protein